MNRNYKVKVVLFFVAMVLPTIIGILWSAVDPRVAIYQNGVTYSVSGPLNVGVILELPWMLLLFILFADEIFVPEEGNESVLRNNGM